MMTFLFVLLLVVIAAAIALVRTIATDGYGTRPPPRSHHEELEPPHRRL